VCAGGERNQGMTNNGVEPLNGEVLLPVALFAARTPEAAAPPPGGLSVTDGTVVGLPCEGGPPCPPPSPQSRLLKSMN